MIAPNHVSYPETSGARAPVCQRWKGDWVIDSGGDVVAVVVVVVVVDAAID
jgi:hypothetical protein